MFVFSFIYILVAGGSWKQEGGCSSYLFIDESSTWFFSSLFFCFLVFFWYIFVLFLLFFSFRRLFLSILSLQIASSTFKNYGFSMEILTFSKIHNFGLEERFWSFLVLFLVHFGCSWGYLVSFLGF